MCEIQLTTIESNIDIDCKIKFSIDESREAKPKAENRQLKLNNKMNQY